MKKQMLAVMLVSSLVGSTYAINSGGCNSPARPTTMTDDFIRYGKKAAQFTMNYFKGLWAKLNHDGYTDGLGETKGGSVTVNGPISVQISGNEEGESLVSGGCGQTINIMQNQVDGVIATGITGPIKESMTPDTGIKGVKISEQPTKSVSEKVKEFFVGLGDSQLVQDVKNAVLEKPYTTGCGAVAGLAVAYCGIGKWIPKGKLGKFTKRMSQLSVIAAGAAAANKYVSEETVVAGMEHLVNGVSYYANCILNTVS